MVKNSRSSEGTKPYTHTPEAHSGKVVPSESLQIVDEAKSQEHFSDENDSSDLPSDDGNAMERLDSEDPVFDMDTSKKRKSKHVLESIKSAGKKPSLMAQKSYIDFMEEEDEKEWDDEQGLNDEQRQYLK